MVQLLLARTFPGEFLTPFPTKTYQNPVIIPVDLFNQDDLVLIKINLCLPTLIKYAKLPFIRQNSATMGNFANRPEYNMFLIHFVVFRR